MIGKPYKVPYVLTQGFGENANTYYKEGGLKGHTALDLVAPHKSEIIAISNCYCYSHLNKDNPNLMQYRAVYTLAEVNGDWLEISYGHLLDIKVEPKTFLKVGDLIGTQGNTGDVAVGGVKVSALEKQNGSGKGTHLHLQFRKVKPIDKKVDGRKYLKDANGYVRFMDKYWEIVDYENGYNGCIDPKPYFIQEDPNLKFKELQILLNKYGANLVVDGKFGSLSKAALEKFLT